MEGRAGESEGPRAGPVPLLRDVIEVLERIYPPASAADWDAVGLVCGDPEIRVRKILFAIDPTLAVVEEARDWGADLVVTHHPLLLRGVHGVPTTTAKGRVIHELVRDSTALYVAHTNADVAAPGVSDALARVIGLERLVPLVAESAPPTDKVVTFVPEDRVEAVVDAMAAAGAGGIGEYERCAWLATGTGTFDAGPTTRPAVGEPGERTHTPEVRVEMRLPRQARAAVVAAARTAHPYEEPAIDVYELAPWSGPTGIGRVGTLSRAITLHELVSIVAEALPSTVQGIRASGPEVGTVHRVAVCGGAGDSLLDAVRRSGADAFVTADLRHHPALEAREEAAGPPWLVDVSHWASEWPWLAGCADRVVAALSTDHGAEHTTVEVRVSTTRTDPWTLHVPSRGGTA
ncbi:MAG: Nif3-like dinuclear metal center hexameric protein [Actinomycetales bacterium]